MKQKLRLENCQKNHTANINTTEVSKVDSTVNFDYFRVLNNAFHFF